jgi:hypothetical protein
MKSHQLVCIGFIIRSPQRPKLALHDALDRRIESHRLQQAAPNVAIGDGAEQTMVVVDHKGDLCNTSVDNANDIA